MSLHAGSGVSVAVAIAILVLCHLSGALSPLENAYLDAQYRALEYTPASDVVIVEIDAHSLRAIDQWPWSRHSHAQFVRQLSNASPRSVFYDVDFSVAAPDASADDALADALAARRYPFVLPAFWQLSTAGRAGGYVLTRPLETFARHTRVGLVNVAPRADGLVRGVLNGDTTHATPIDAAIALLAPTRGGVSVAEHPIDFRISPATFPRLSFVDVLNGRTPATALTDKVVFVGATALELGDILPVPVHRALPGVVVQALAYQTMRSGGPLVLQGWFSVILGATMIALMPLMMGAAWRRSLTWAAIGVVVIVSATTALHAGMNVIVPAMPLVLALVLCAGLSLAFAADYQSLRALLSGVRLSRREALISSVLAGSIDGILVCGDDLHIRDANAASARLLGLPLDRLQQSDIRDVIPGIDAWTRLDSKGAQSGRTFEFVRSNNDGAPPLDVSVTTVNLKERILHTIIIRDATERRQQHDLLQHQATHDALTGLPNRVMLTRALEQLDRNSRSALFMLDLDRFKDVNDTLGHATGDSVLTILGQRLRSTLASHNMIARIGGDEFAVVVPCYDRLDELTALAETILARVRNPVKVGPNLIELGASIGIALCPEHGADGGLLLQHADVAMYRAKHRRTGIEFYDEGQDASSIRNMEMLRALRVAVSEGALDLVYQPKIRLSDMQCTGVEALVRWSHPELGPISPAEFIPLAEDNDLIAPLTSWVLDRALKDHKAWRSRGMTLDLAINLSARHLRDQGFVFDLLERIERNGIEPRHLEFEITETAVMSDPETAMDVLQSLARVGVRAAIDDFGTGYSSLAYLKHLKLDVLKIDRSFVRDLCTDSNDRAIVETTLQLARNLSLEVVAEGIENQAQFERLREMGCASGQGYWIAKPMPAEELRTWCTAWDRGRAQLQASPAVITR